MQMTDPEGSIFLPKTERDLRNYQTGLLLGRGPGEGKTPGELEVHYNAAEHAIKELREKLSPDMASVALAPEI